MKFSVRSLIMELGFKIFILTAAKGYFAANEKDCIFHRQNINTFTREIELGTYYRLETKYIHK